MFKLPDEKLRGIPLACNLCAYNPPFGSTDILFCIPCAHVVCASCRAKEIDKGKSCNHCIVCLKRCHSIVPVYSESLPVKYRNIAWRSSQTLLKDAQMSMKYRYVHEKMYRRAVSKKIESLERSLRESQSTLSRLHQRNDFSSYQSSISNPPSTASSFKMTNLRSRPSLQRYTSSLSSSSSSRVGLPPRSPSFQSGFQQQRQQQQRQQQQQQQMSRPKTPRVFETPISKTRASSSSSSSSRGRDLTSTSLRRNDTHNRRDSSRRNRPLTPLEKYRRDLREEAMRSSENKNSVRQQDTKKSEEDQRGRNTRTAPSMYYTSPLRRFAFNNDKAAAKRTINTAETSGRKSSYFTKSNFQQQRSRPSSSSIRDATSLISKSRPSSSSSSSFVKLKSLAPLSSEKKKKKKTPPPPSTPLSSQDLKPKNTEPLNAITPETQTDDVETQTDEAGSVLSERSAGKKSAASFSSSSASSSSFLKRRPKTAPNSHYRRLLYSRRRRK